MVLNDNFDPEDSVNAQMLIAASKLESELNDLKVWYRMGVYYSQCHQYYGWKLVFEITSKSSQVQPLISKYFNWDKIESQDRVDFNNLMQR